MYPAELIVLGVLGLLDAPFAGVTGMTAAVMLFFKSMRVKSVTAI